MPELQDSRKPYDLCQQLVAETDPVRRSQAIANVRDLIEAQRQTPRSAEDDNYLEVATMVLDFLEEALNARPLD